QGLSTSLPEDVQLMILNSIPGMQNVEMMRPGYAIEYDAILPSQLWPSLETKRIKNLFTAGQINGTSGYEEAAGQGIMAGINAARRALGKEPIILERSEAYIGVLIDDLVTKGTIEPYRLLTSRAEYRLLLRHDNADLRLTERGYEIGLIPEERYERFKEKIGIIEKEKNRLEKTKARPDINPLLKEVGSVELNNAVELSVLLKRPEVTYKLIARYAPADYLVPDDVAEQVETQIKFAGYIDKQILQVQRMRKVEHKIIHDDVDYSLVHNLSSEAKEKLNKIRPLSIGQASRISGVTPADISILMVYLESKNKIRN
ncbi:MAG: FAD-dependent oxidoreductase, partial [Bacilli bacterium]